MDVGELHATAQMARLTLSPAEIEKLGKAVEQMLLYFSHLQKIDVNALIPTTHAVVADSGLREDREFRDISPDSLLANAPQREDRFIVIPNVL